MVGTSQPSTPKRATTFTADSPAPVHFTFDPYENPQPRNCTIVTDQGDAEADLSDGDWPKLAMMLEMQRDAEAQAHPHKPHSAVPEPTPTLVPEVPSPSPASESTPSVPQPTSEGSQVSNVTPKPQPSALLNPQIQAVAEFMKSYFDASNSGDVDALAAKYAERVDFLDFGIKTRDQVRAQLASWYHQFPKHHITLTDRIHFTQETDGSLDLTYSTHSRLEAADGKWSEEDHMNAMRIQSIGGSFLINRKKLVSSSHFVHGG